MYIYSGKSFLNSLVDKKRETILVLAARVSILE